MAHDTTDPKTVGTHFLEFSIYFLNLAKCQYRQQNEIKAGTLGFHAMALLGLADCNSPTMSQLAADLGITKQQLTKLVNSLEEKGFVTRHHSRENRRLVYLNITPLGLTVLNQLKEDMLDATVRAFDGYSEEELADMDQCLIKLSALLKKFITAQSPVEP
jgi:DNA-binding MarR family transcriptional regulator